MERGVCLSWRIVVYMARCAAQEVMNPKRPNGDRKGTQMGALGKGQKKPYPGVKNRWLKATTPGWEGEGREKTRAVERRRS